MIEKVEITPDIWIMVWKSTYNLFPAEIAAMTSDGGLIASITVIDDKLKDRQFDIKTISVGHYWVTGRTVQGGALYSLGAALHVFVQEIDKILKDLNADIQKEALFGTVMELVKTWIESDERITKKGD